MVHNGARTHLAHPGIRIGLVPTRVSGSPADGRIVRAVSLYPAAKASEERPDRVRAAAFLAGKNVRELRGFL